MLFLSTFERREPCGTVDHVLGSQFDPFQLEVILIDRVQEETSLRHRVELDYIECQVVPWVENTLAPSHQVGELKLVGA